MNEAQLLIKGKILKGHKGTYQILRHLGGGGFGQTYLAIAEAQPDKPHCAIKQLKLDPQINLSLQEAWERFQREADVLEKLGNHPQIPSLWDNFEENNEFYFVQDFIDGQDLSKEITEGRQWSEGAVIGLLWDVLQVLKFIQERDKPVIHRDIKPNNLIRRKSDCKIVVIDFGVFKEIVATPNCKTILTLPFHTPWFAPKEQVEGKPRTNSDIYALGMTAIYALTGIQPRRFDYNTQTGEIMLPNWQVSAELTQILEKMVRYHYQDRYQWATEVINDLTNLHSIGSKI